MPILFSLVDGLHSFLSLPCDQYSCSDIILTIHLRSNHCIIAQMSHNSPDPRSEYDDYTHMSRTDHFIGASSTIVDLVKEVSDLIPNAGPLSQVLGITGQLFTIINQIKANKDDCMFLVERILRFLKDIAEECKQLDPPIRAGSRTASRLNDLIS